MSVAENKLLVHRYIEEVVNTGDVERIPEFLSDEYAEIYEGTRYELGAEGAREHVLGVRETYPDLHLTVEHQIAEDDWVATVYHATGTHTGKWLGMKPTGKGVFITGVNLDRVADGRIIEHGGAANLLDPLLKIGAIRVVGQEG